MSSFNPSALIASKFDISFIYLLKKIKFESEEEIINVLIKLNDMDELNENGVPYRHIYTKKNHRKVMDDCVLISIFRKRSTIFFQKIVNILNISERIRIFIKDNLTNIPKYEEFNDKPNYFYPLILAVRTNNSDFIKGFILELKDINFSDEDAKYFIDNIEQDIDELTFLTFFRFILAHCSDAHEIMSILTGVLFTGKLNRTLLSNFYIFQKDKSQSEKIKFMKKCSEKFWIFSYKSKKPYRVLYFLESDLFYENDSADYRNLFYYCMDLIYDDERHNMCKILIFLS